MKVQELTGLVSGVVIRPGAMQLARISSFAHSQARFLINLFIVPRKSENTKNAILEKL